jgi:hypothetical protein
MRGVGDKGLEKCRESAVMGCNLVRKAGNSEGARGVMTSRLG